MKKRRIGQAWMLGTLSLLSVGTYVSTFAFSSKATAQQMVLPEPEGSQAQAKLQQLTATYQSLMQLELKDEDDLQQVTNKYSQAYQVAQQDDQVLSQISQQLQSMGQNPINLQSTPAPLSGVTVNTSPPMVQSTTRAS